MTNEEMDLVRKGKQMMQDGLGAKFVRQWLIDRVPDIDRQNKVLNLVFDLSQNKQTKPKVQVIKERRLRKNRYLVEDYEEAVAKLYITGVSYILLGIIYLLPSLLLQADNLSHAMICIVVGIVYLLCLKPVDWYALLNIIAAFSMLIALIVLEYYFVGLPDSIIPSFGILEEAGSNIVTVIMIFNDISILIYYALKVALLYPLVKLLNQYRLVSNIPEDLKRTLQINLR